MRPPPRTSTEWQKRGSAATEVVEHKWAMDAWIKEERRVAHDQPVRPQAR